MKENNSVEFPMIGKYTLFVPNYIRRFGFATYVALTINLKIPKYIL